MILYHFNFKYFVKLKDYIRDLDHVAVIILFLQTKSRVCSFYFVKFFWLGCGRSLPYVIMDIIEGLYGGVI